MRIVKATIEIASDGGYGVYCVNAPFSGMGATVEEAKQDMLNGIEVYKETCKEDGYSYPAWLDKPYQFVYQFDAQSLLRYYAGIITPAALGRISGINPKQLWSYMHGKSKPREAQIRKIETALHTLGRELSAISL